MPILQTTGVMNKGDTFLPLEMRMPPGRNKKYKTELINFLASTTGENVQHSVELTFNPAEQDTKEFHFTQLYDPDPAKKELVTPKKLRNRMVGHSKNVSEYFQIVNKLPTFTYQKGIEMYRVIVPARTAFYSTDPYFFEYALGVKDAVEFEVKLPGDPNMSTVYGFSNVGDRDEVFYSKEKHPEDSNLRGELPPLTTDAAEATYMYVQLMPHVVTRTDQKALLPNLTLTTERLSRLTAAALSSMGFSPITLQVYETNDGIAIVNRLVQNCKYVLSLKFSPAVKEFLGLTNEELNFPLNAVSSYVLQTNKTMVGLDPFARHYPITAAWTGFGEATSFIQGRGSQSVLAFIKSPQHLRSSDAYIVQNDSKLRLFFVDKHLKIIKIAASAKIYVTFQLVPL
jgi:hypothetical protein